MKKMRMNVRVFGAVFLITESIFSITGLDIMKKNDALPEAKSQKASAVLVIFKGGRQIRKEYNMISKKYGKVTRTRISFTKPTRLEFLTYSIPGSDNQQWLKLSSGAVRKIASSEKDKPFVNSHFYYEDIGDRDINDYRYKYLGEVKVTQDLGKGKTAQVDCYKVEGVKKKGTKVYSKTIAYVRKSDYFIIQVDFYEKGRHTKTLRAEHIKKVQGILTPFKLVMERTDGKGKSILYIRPKSLQYNISIPDVKLKREAL